MEPLQQPSRSSSPAPVKPPSTLIALLARWDFYSKGPTPTTTQIREAMIADGLPTEEGLFARDLT